LPGWTLDEVFLKMKLLLESWRRYLKEVHSGCPEKHPMGDHRVYYAIDRFNPPPVEDLLECWMENSGYVRDSSVNWKKPAFYKTEDLIPHREYKRHQLMNKPGTERYEELKADIEENGIKETLIIYFGKNGGVKIGEGNHRHEIALDLGIPEVPVRFVFWQNVYKNEVEDEEDFNETPI